MLALGGVLVFAAYTVGGWGYVLVRGWNIPLRAWVSPLHPYQWPAGRNPDQIPDTQIFPSGASTAEPSNAPGYGPAPGVGQLPSVQRAQRAAKAAHRPLPGSVASRL